MSQKRVLMEFQAVIPARQGGLDELPPALVFLRDVSVATRMSLWDGIVQENYEVIACSMLRKLSPQVSVLETVTDPDWKKMICGVLPRVMDEIWIGTIVPVLETKRMNEGFQKIGYHALSVQLPTWEPAPILQALLENDDTPISCVKVPRAM
jgi:hypothetical protein